MIISINSKRTTHRETFNRRLTSAGALLAVFALSLLLIACPSPGGGYTNPSGGGTTAPYGGTPTPPPKPKAWHVTTFAGGGSAGTDGIGAAAGFAVPFSITQSGDTLYVADEPRHSIRTIDTSTARVGTLVTGRPGGGHANGNGTTARFNFPSGIAAVDDSTIYVADSMNNRIRLLTIGAAAAAVQVSDFAGSGTRGHANAAGAAAEFDNPMGIAVSENTLYVADQNNHRIRAIDLASPNKTVSTIAGSGTQGFKDGTGAAAEFDRPAGLAVSGTTLYVSEYGGHRIRAIDLASPNKTVSTVAGSGTAGYKDGTAAQFNRPTGIAVSGTTLYVADYDNHRIRAIDLTSPEKTVSTIAGDGTAGNTDGIGSAAKIGLPSDIVVSGDTLYVTSGKLIRKLEYREVGS